MSNDFESVFATKSGATDRNGGLERFLAKSLAFIGCFILFLNMQIPPCEAFPIDQFKDFISKKPTINNFDFKVKSKKFSYRGLDTNTYRIFNFVMENDNIYRLTEDRSEYVLTIPDPESKLKTINIKPVAKASWGRYENQFWNTFNSNGVITTSLDGFGEDPAFGPGKLAEMNSRVAYDALNLGIMDLKSGGVAWDGLRFSSSSNTLGYRISGHLLLNDDNTPTNLFYTLSKDGRSYNYSVSYVFSTNSSIPAFFPSRIRIELLRGAKPTITSEYQIIDLSLSNRKIQLHEVSLHYEDTNTVKFVFTNKQYYKLQTNVLINIGSSMKSSTSGNIKRWTVIALIILLTCVPPIAFLYHRNQKKLKL